MDILHQVLIIARDNKLFRAPITRQSPRIMDLGAGTGIWAIQVADDLFRDAQVMAVDLNMIQPEWIPPELTIKQYDIEEPAWDTLLMDCDLIHLRMLLGSIRTDLWPQIYRNIFEHLTPGFGYVEQVEIDWTPRWDDDDTKPTDSQFQHWAKLFLAGMDNFNRSARVEPEDTRRMIEAAGFTEVGQEVIRAYVCPCSLDWRKRKLARWFNCALTYSLEPFSFMPLIEKQVMKYTDVLELCEKVKNEICTT
ncbi:hypothetical protein FDECE_10696 [Fusarium decemcellulare]|nr:hypothetical protein FDECE_10696 [Fusarium decemcellulare]